MTVALPKQLLLVEDNPAHAELLQRLLLAQALVNDVAHVTDGEQALDYLFRRADYADPETSPQPAAILLDIRLPRMSGLEVLAAIRADPRLRCIPVIILSTSRAEVDIRRAYDNGVNSYLTKPMDFADYEALATRISQYWLGVNQLPEDCGPP